MFPKFFGRLSHLESLLDDSGEREREKEREGRERAEERCGAK